MDSGVGDRRSHFLNDMTPRSGAQRRGLGAALLDAGERWCRDTGCDAIQIRVVNLRAELAPFYGRRGYEACGVEPFTGPTKRACHFIVMRKALRG